MPDDAIVARGLVKRFGQVVALDGLSLRVARGSCFGLLGPNGAGKTTTVSVLTTLTLADEGSAAVLGRDVVAERALVRRELGLVFQETTLDPELTAREQLDLHGRLYHLADRRARVGEALALAGLEADADRPVRGFSGGMKRRLELVRGLLHRPRILFLDEPTLGLDVAARAGIWEELRRLRRTGDVTLFLTTHSMEEADALCDCLAIVDRGRVVVEGPPERLKAALGGDVVVLTLERAEPRDEVMAKLGALPGVTRVTQDGVESSGGVFRIVVANGPQRLPELLYAARPFGVREVLLHRPTLEHVFLHHTGHPFELGRQEGEGRG
ncbi:MAG TPA: ATP-binding cassette domain-containing protein [Myxococcota bacterium]|nr:ATP-binding cassette domain-containing protein [Myxococcota bacterium]